MPPYPPLTTTVEELGNRNIERVVTIVEPQGVLSYTREARGYAIIRMLGNPGLQAPRQRDP